MAYTTEFITTSREDIFAIGRILAAALEAEQIFGRAKALTVTVNGSLSSGKSIIGRQMIETLMGPDNTRVLDGYKDHDEIWRGQIAGRPAEIAYMDANWVGSSYSRDELNFPRSQKAKKEEVFKSLRRRGGLNIIQNADTEGGIEFFVESHLSYGLPGGSRIAGSPLRQAYETARQSAPDWARYVSVTVTDDKLLKSETFMQAVRGLSTSVAAVAKEIRVDQARRGFRQAKADITTRLPPQDTPEQLAERRAKLDAARKKLGFDRGGLSS